MVGVGMKAKRKRGFLRNKRVRRWILLFFAILILAWLLSLAVLDPDGFAAFFRSGSRAEDPGGTRPARDMTESSPQRTDPSTTAARPLDLARAALRELRRDPTDRDRYRRFEELWDTLDETSRAALEQERRNVHGEVARRFEAQVRDELGRLEMQSWRMGADGRFHRAEHALAVLRELYPQFTDEARTRFAALSAKLDEARGPWIAERRAHAASALEAGDAGAAFLAMRKLVEAGHAEALDAAAAVHAAWLAERAGSAPEPLDAGALADAAAKRLRDAVAAPNGLDELAMLDDLLGLLARCADGDAVRRLGRWHRDLELVAFPWSQRLALLAGDGLETEPIEGWSTWRGRLAVEDAKLTFESRGTVRPLRAGELEPAVLDALAAALFESYGLGRDLERFGLALVLAHLGDWTAERALLRGDGDGGDALAADRAALLAALAR